MKCYLFYFILVTLFVSSSCSSSKRGGRELDFNAMKSKTYLLMPFDVRTRNAASISNFLDRMRYRLLSEFQQRAFKILDIYQFETRLIENDMAIERLYDEQMAEACRILGADAAISCRISDTMTRSMSSEIYKMRTYIQVTLPETGEIIYTTNKNKKLSSISGLELEQYAAELARSIAMSYEEGRR